MATVDAAAGTTSVFRERIQNDLLRFRKFFFQMMHNKLSLVGFVIIVFFLVLSLSAPLIVGPYPTPLQKSLTTLDPPSSAHPLGTDRQGYDILTLLLYGGQISLLIGFTASIVAMLVGTSVGLAAGYYGGVTDQMLARFTDFFLVIPWLPFVIILVSVLGRSLGTLIFAIAIVSWPTTARVIRAQVLSLRERMFVERARAVGAGSIHIVWKHILPNVMPLVWAEAVLTISSAVFTEAFLSFFGLGVQGGIVSWGTMVNDSYGALAELNGMWWYFLPPGLFITIVVLGFAMLGYGLEEIFNPALKRRG